MPSRSFPIVLCCAVVLSAATIPTHGWARDTHYHLTFGLATATCFTWEEARILASGDVGIDGNLSTRSERSMSRKHNKLNWHAFGHSEERLNALWMRAVDEDDVDLKLFKFGQFLHFLQDWEPHAGYPMSIGHALATITGKDPDSLAKNEARSARMVQSTLDHMAMMCAHLDRLPSRVPDPDLALLALADHITVDGLLRDLIDNSSPKWRARMSGGLTPEGHDIVATNVERVERFIAKQVVPIAGDRIPDGFDPADDRKGIPPPLGIPTDRDGELIASLAETVVRGDGVVDAGEVEATDDGWRVAVTVRNDGEVALDPARLRVLAIDPLLEARLGETEIEIPAVPPGGRHGVEVAVAMDVDGRPARVLIGVAYIVDDHIALNNELWLMHPENGSPPMPPPPELPAVQSVEFAGEPKPHATAGGALWMVVTARTDRKDPTEEITLPTFALSGGGPVLAPDDGPFPDVWNLSFVAPDARPAAKTFVRFDVGEELCNRVSDPDTAPGVDVTLRADDLVVRRTVVFDAATRAAIATVCKE